MLGKKLKIVLNKTERKGIEMARQSKVTIPKKGDCYLGLDLSLTGTGIVVLGDSNTALHAEVLKNKLRGEQRLLFLRDRVAEVIKEFVPAIICLEGYSMGSRIGQAFSIGELGGVIRANIYEQGFDYFAIPPTRLKKFITGGGKAEKDMIVFHVYKRWGFEAKDNNMADAYGLAQVAKSIANKGKGLIKAQEEVIKDILIAAEAIKKGAKNDS